MVIIQHIDDGRIRGVGVAGSTESIIASGIQDVLKDPAGIFLSPAQFIDRKDIRLDVLDDVRQVLILQVDIVVLAIAEGSVDSVIEQVVLHHGQGILGEGCPGEGQEKQGES